jgi:hypothetical protein
MYICTRVNLQDMYFEHVNAHNKILTVCIIFLVVSHELGNVSNSSTKPYVFALTCSICTLGQIYICMLKYIDVYKCACKWGLCCTAMHIYTIFKLHYYP